MEKIEFHGKKSSFTILEQNEFPSKRTKKEPENELVRKCLTRFFGELSELLVPAVLNSRPNNTIT